MAPPRVNLAGQRFGILTVVGQAGTYVGGRSLWKCRCDCGNVALVRHGNMRSQKSCGCAKAALCASAATTHGHTSTTEYNTWRCMLSRCHKPEAEQFKYYGARGISVCPEWRESFEAFFAVVGPKPSPGHTLDRINNDGNYEPGNVRWATPKEQANNRRKADPREPVITPVPEYDGYEVRI